MLRSKSYTFFGALNKPKLIQEDAHGNITEYQTSIFQDSGGDEAWRKIKADTGENTGLRVKCGATGVKTFFYRYTSPITSKLVQVKIGHFPETSLAEARLKLHELKQIRRQGRCPRTEAREQQQQEKEQEKARVEPVEKSFTVKDLVELYLTQYIEDRKSPNGQIITGARKSKGPSETRRTLYGDAIPKLEGYANIMSKMEERPIRLGLYFPLLGGWREWAY